MTQGFDDLKKFAISDILSVSGKDKTTRVIENHMNNLIEISLIKGAASRQAEINLLEKEIIETQRFLNNQNCIKQAEIDELQKRLSMYERQGYKLVPVEPTEKMLDAARRRQLDDLSSPFEDMDMLKYKAMIGAVE